MRNVNARFDDGVAYRSEPDRITLSAYLHRNRATFNALFGKNAPLLQESCNTVVSVLRMISFLPSPLYPLHYFYSVFPLSTELHNIILCGVSRSKRGWRSNQTQRKVLINQNIYIFVIYNFEIKSQIIVTIAIIALYLTAKSNGGGLDEHVSHHNGKQEICRRPYGWLETWSPTMMTEPGR